MTSGCGGCVLQQDHCSGTNSSMSIFLNNLLITHEHPYWETDVRYEEAPILAVRGGSGVGESRDMYTKGDPSSVQGNNKLIC